jgi:hypothetical protein
MQEKSVHHQKLKSPNPHAEERGFVDISFGSPAFRLCGPIGFASPGYPGFAIIGIYYSI